MGAKNTQGEHGRTVPNSIRHKRILDIAADRPEASIKDIADEVPSATTDLVEHVLEEYGDPAASEVETENSNTDGDFENNPPPANESESKESKGDSTELPDVSELTEKQRETLRAILATPEATQEELGEMLGVTNVTISNWVNSIDGFEWENRVHIAERLLSALESNKSDHEMTTNETTAEDALSDIGKRLEAVEEMVADLHGHTDTSDFEIDAELGHKVIHACIKSERISEEEELRLLKSFLD